MHKCLKWLLITLMALTQITSGSRVVLAHDVSQKYQHDTISGLQLAQFQYDREQQRLESGSGDDARIDVDPPLIEHEVIEEVEAGIRQNFVASVVDDEELDSVLLFYRFTGETSFSRFTMTQVSFSSTYIAQIPTDPTSYTPIEYYIQARDTSGNRTVRGYAFSPLIRNIVPFVPIAENVEPTVGSAVENSEQTATRHLPKAVYIVGGVLLLGLIASAAGSSGGGSGNGGGGACSAVGCRLTLTVSPPF